MCPFVHEHAIQMTRLDRADLYGLLAPAHDLIRPDVCCKAKRYSMSNQTIMHVQGHVDMQDKHGVVRQKLNSPATDVLIDATCILLLSTLL